MQYTIGIDFGTLSARAVVLSLLEKKVVSSCTVDYPHGVMDKTLCDGTPLPPDFALQHPDDYLFALKKTISGALQSAGIKNTDVSAVCIDFTSCTVLAHLEDGTPLCNVDKFKSDPHAYVKLWKHHGAKKEAEQLEHLARECNAPWLKYYNNTVSSECFFAKVLESCRNSPELYDTAYRFSEAGDWLSYLLTGVDSHSVSFAGFKCFWDEKDGYPSAQYLESVEPKFKNIIGTKVSQNVVPVGSCVGTVTDIGAALSGLAVGTKVVCPMIDAHSPMLALGITEPGTLMAVLGTSGCYIVHDTEQKSITGVSGSSVSSVIPDLCTYEAPLACFGDHLAWFTNLCGQSHKQLTASASQLKIGESGLVALNWFNGNRCPLSDFSLSGLVAGLTLTTKPHEIYRALLEGAVFATAIIIEGYTAAGIEINNIIATGGIAQKNELLMQILADVLNRPIFVSNSAESAAHGDAIYAAYACGAYPTLQSAASALCSPAQKQYIPNPESHKKYLPLFNIYKTLHNHFGVDNADIMHTLKELQQNATKMDME